MQHRACCSRLTRTYVCIQEAKAKAEALARALESENDPAQRAVIEGEVEKLGKKFNRMMAASGCKNLRDLVHKVCTQTDAYAQLKGDTRRARHQRMVGQISRGLAAARGALLLKPALNLVPVQLVCFLLTKT
jgi:hypothetical protein